MLHPQIVVRETDGLLAGGLRALATSERWALREMRQTEPLVRVLGSGGPTVFVIRFGRAPESDLELMGLVGWQLPDVATVAVGGIDTDPALAGLAWDLGAAFVLFPPQSRDLLPEVVAGLMKRAVHDSLPAALVPETPP